MKLKLFMLYVDDSLAIIKKDSADCCIMALNGFNDNLFFTYEKKVNNNISFSILKLSELENN